MTTTFEMNASEMDHAFVEAVRGLFKNHLIKISIETADDLTSILNQSPATKSQLTSAMTGSRAGNIIPVEMNDLFAQIRAGVDFDTYMANLR